MWFLKKKKKRKEGYLFEKERVNLAKKLAQMTVEKHRLESQKEADLDGEKYNQTANEYHQISQHFRRIESHQEYLLKACEDAPTHEDERDFKKRLNENSRLLKQKEKELKASIKKVNVFHARFEKKHKPMDARIEHLNSEIKPLKHKLVRDYALRGNITVLTFPSPTNEIQERLNFLHNQIAELGGEMHLNYLMKSYVSKKVALEVLSNEKLEKELRELQDELDALKPQIDEQIALRKAQRGDKPQKSVAARNIEAILREDEF